MTPVTTKKALGPIKETLSTDKISLKLVSMVSIDKAY
jgi:hypothetical protein